MTSQNLLGTSLNLLMHLRPRPLLCPCQVTFPDQIPTNFSDYLITSLSVMLKKAPRHEGKSKGGNIVVLPLL